MLQFFIVKEDCNQWSAIDSSRCFQLKCHYIMLICIQHPTPNTQQPMQYHIQCIYVYSIPCSHLPILNGFRPINLVRRSTRSHTYSFQQLASFDLLPILWCVAVYERKERGKKNKINENATTGRLSIRFLLFFMRFPYVEVLNLDLITVSFASRFVYFVYHRRCGGDVVDVDSGYLRFAKNIVGKLNMQISNMRQCSVLVQTNSEWYRKRHNLRRLKHIGTLADTQNICTVRMRMCTLIILNVISGIRLIPQTLYQLDFLSFTQGWLTLFSFFPML